MSTSPLNNKCHRPKIIVAFRLEKSNNAGAGYKFTEDSLAKFISIKHELRELLTTYTFRIMLFAMASFRITCISFMSKMELFEKLNAMLTRVVFTHIFIRKNMGVKRKLKLRTEI